LNAINMVFKHDSFLLEHSVNERSITHKLAEYLRPIFGSYHIDCEYNRHGLDVKTLPRECRGKNIRYVYPDVVVHIRGNDDRNLLVIEAKLRPSLDACDAAKLTEFTAPTGRYHYAFGLFIGFNGLEPPKRIWFRAGEIWSEAVA
jgi:hypothetical protein